MPGGDGLQGCFDVGISGISIHLEGAAEARQKRLCMVAPTPEFIDHDRATLRCDS